MTLTITYRTFLYISRFYGREPVLYVGSTQHGIPMVDGKPKIKDNCKFVRWLDADWKTESVEVDNDRI